MSGELIPDEHNTGPAARPGGKDMRTDLAKGGRGRAIIAAVVMAMLPWGAAATETPHTKSSMVDLATADAARWIVQLRAPSLATYRGGIDGLPATSPVATGARRLDVASPASAAYLARLDAQRAAAIARVRALVPAARVQREYRIVLNGFSVAMDKQHAALVRALPGVKAVTPDVGYQRQGFATPTQIGATGVWTRLGGAKNAAAGVKIAIIDSGIYVTKDPAGKYTGNPCFADAGYKAPAGYPKGDKRFTNNKVIVSRAYFRPDDPPIAEDALPIPGEAGHSHGTHVAGTTACNAATPVTYQGVKVSLSGIAPGAYLMNYRVFYTSQTTHDFQNGNAYVTELAAAIEDSVADGADVVSNSWGSSYQNTKAWPDPMVVAAEAATDAGAVMVFAQGNSGPAPATGNAPSNSPKVIAVGASTKSATIATGDVSVAGGPPAIQKIPVGPAPYGPRGQAVGPATYTPAESVAIDGSSLGCSVEGQASPYPPGAMSGSIALIQRGVCAFTEKVLNAQNAGAIAAIVYNSAGGGENLQAMTGSSSQVTIPALFMRRKAGLAMVEHRAANPGAQASFTPNGRMVPNPGEVMASFSSRGPTGDQLIKPDVVAPGVDILSGGYGGGGYPAELQGFGAVSGTSMATPCVAGAAALLVAAHPTWTPAQIKSALMTSANQEVWADSARTVVGGVMDRGAGRINLARAVAPGLTLDRPSLSAGIVPAGRAITFTITATDALGTGGAYLVTSKTTNGLTVSAPKTVTVAPGGSATFAVTLSTKKGVAVGPREGTLTLRGPATLNVPMHLQVVPAQPQTDVLLIDDDGSAADPSLIDVQPQYRAMLDQLGYSYDVVEPWTDGLPGFNELLQYRMALYFTGNNASFDTSGLTFDDHDALSQWMDAGGHMLATGQNLAEVTDTGGFDSARIGRSRLYHGYFGVLQESPSAYQALPPSPTADGAGIFDGLRIDLSPGAGGLPNQTSVEVMAPMFDNDSYQAIETVKPAFTAAGTPEGAALGFVRSSDPTLEQPRSKFEYRSIALGFGLEGVSGNGGTATGAAVLGRAIRWLIDDVSVVIGDTYHHGAVWVNARVASSVRASIKQVRIDWGDGSPIATGPRAMHDYQPGVYFLRVEATDALGRRTVTTRKIVQGPRPRFIL